MRATTLILLSLCAAACETSGPLPRTARCLGLPASDSPVMARIGDTSLTISDVERRLKEQGSAARRYNDAASLRRFVEDQVRVELLAQAAIERGLDRDPDVVEAARKVMVRKLLLQDLGPQAWGDQVSDDAVRVYYDSHLDEYTQPERRRVAQIQFAPTPDGRAAAQSTIDKLLAISHDDTPRTFARFAAQYSLDRESRARGGELVGFLSKEELGREYGQHFADEAFGLAVGVVSPTAAQSTRGWHVLSILAKRDPYARGIEEVTDEIRGRLITTGRSQLFEKYLSQLRQRYPVALYEDRLPELAAEVAGGQKKERP